MSSVKLKHFVVAGAAVTLLVAGGTTLKYVLMGGKNPGRLLNFVASGIYGESAYTEGASMVVVGALLHVIVSYGWAIIFSLFSHRLAVVSKDWRAAGIVYGIIIWAGMVFIAMPLSKIGFLGLDFSGALLDIALLILCAGLPISYINRNSLSSQS